MATTDPKEKTPEEAARLKKERDEAIALREDNWKKSRPSRDVQLNWKERHDWTYWVDVAPPPEEAPSEPQGGVSSAPMTDDKPLKKPPYWCMKRGTNPPLRAYFDYDEKKKEFQVVIDIRQSKGGDHIKFVPKSASDWKRHAEISGKEAVRFLAIEGKFSKIKLTFPEDHKFETGASVPHYGTLAYAEAKTHAQLEEALKLGVGFSVSENFIQAVMDKRGARAAQELKDKIAKANESAEKRETLKEFLNDGSMKNHYDALSGAKELGLTDVEDFKKEVDQVLRAHTDKIDTLNKDIRSLDEEIKALQDKIDDLPAGSSDLAGLETEKAGKEEIRAQKNKELQIEQDLATSLENAHLADAADKVGSKESLDQVKEKFEALKNPNQQYKDALGELKKALAGIDKADRREFDDATKEAITNAESKIKELEEKLKQPLTNTERATIKSDIDKLKDAMKANPAVKERCGDAIDKADKLVKGEKASMVAADRLENRLKALEAAAEDISKAMNKYAEMSGADPSKDHPLQGMILRKRAWHERGHFKRIETHDDAKKYIGKRFDGLREQRERLLEAIKAEKESLARETGKLSPDEQKKIEERLQAVQDKTEKVVAKQKELDETPAYSPKHKIK